jgi:hypothetical protein
VVLVNIMSDAKSITVLCPASIQTLALSVRITDEL